MPGEEQNQKNISSKALGASIRSTSSASSSSKLVIFAVDSGAQSFRRIKYGLRRRYGIEYQVVCESSAMWGMKRLRELDAAGQEVALILADQWMPDIRGTEFLMQASQLFPAAKRALLIEWGDRTSQEPVLRAVTLGHIDYYIPKPAGPGDENFHKMIAEFLYDWAKIHRPVFKEIEIVGEHRAPRSHELKDILMLHKELTRRRF